MANTRTLNHSFAGGEISPEMYGRIDDVKYQSGAALLKNFIATPQGPAANRPGFEYVRGTRNNHKARLIPFVFSDDQAMVIELGAGYFRFHAEGATLEYPDSAPAWKPPSGAITISYSTPAMVTWTGHGLVTGDPVMFYLYGTATLDGLPAGLQLGHTYTVEVIDANHFYLIDNGALLGLSTVAESGAHFECATGVSVTAFSTPSGTVTQTSEAIGSFPSTTVPGGIATLTVTLTGNAMISSSAHSTTVKYQYNSGAGWVDFMTRTDIHSTSWSNTGSLQVAVANIANLQLRCVASVSADTFAQTSVSAAINAPWSIDIPVTAIEPYSGVRCYYDYEPGDVVSYATKCYSALVAGGGLIVPGNDDTVWQLLPADGVYEVDNPYAEEDLFDIHYAQSQDVLTLVHPKYPPAELSRLGAYMWKYAPIQFGQLLPAPTGVSVTASPGYVAKIESITIASPALITTVASHTLALGDGIYIDGLKATVGGVQKDFSGFYLVAKVPADSSGALIPDQLTVMDYNGNLLNSTNWTSVYYVNATIQYGSKIFDIVSHYVVTALTSDGINQSPVSADVSVLDNLNVSGSYNTIAWNAVPGASRYWVYKKKNGLFGYIGETTELSFRDNNIAPDFSITPPLYDPLWSVPGDYPGAVGYYDQRRCFGGSTNKPQDVGMSKTGTESDFSYSLPVRDTDRIYFRVASLQANKVRHIIPLTQLLLLTSSTEFRVSPLNSDAITPTDISAKAQSYVGASNVVPNIINNSLVYCANRGGHVRELGYNWQANGFITGDLSLRAIHLFDNLKIQDQTYQKAPHPIVWFVSSNGNLLGLTYIPEQQIGAWHQHTTDGTFESVCAIPEGTEDRLYAIIKRNVLVDVSPEIGDLVTPVELGTNEYVAWVVPTTASAGTDVPPQNDSKATSTAAALGDVPGTGEIDVSWSRPVNPAYQWVKWEGFQVPTLPEGAVIKGCYACVITEFDEPNPGKSAVAHIILNNGAWDSSKATDGWNSPVAWDSRQSSFPILSTTDPLHIATTVSPDDVAASSVKIALDASTSQDDAGVVMNVTAVAVAVVYESASGPMRNVQPTDVRYIERMASRIIDKNDPKTWFFVDCGARYSNENPVTTISGLDWLEGKTVAILADGGVQPSQLVANGTITLAHAARNIQLGLPYEWDTQTLPPTLQAAAFGMGRIKNTNKVWIKVTKSSGIWVGPKLDKLIEYKQRTTEPYGTPPRLVDDEIEIVLTPEWQQTGQIYIHGEAPLPMTITALTTEVSVGG